MAKYIDADKMIAYCKEALFSPVVQGIIEQVIDEQPAADVEPVKHGKIKPFSDLFGNCSECEFLMERGWKYCPGCGAKMNGEE